MNRILLTAAGLALFSAPGFCGDVSVTLTGTVSTNSYSSGMFGGVSANDTAVLSFDVNLPGMDIVAGQLTNFPIDLPTFDLDINGSTGSALAGATNLQIQNDFPASDGFRIFMTQLATGEFFQCEFGALGSFFNGTTQIDQLAGTYDVASNLTSFGYTIQGGGGFMEIFPETLEISVPQQYCVVITTEILSNSYSSGPLAAPSGTDAIMTFNVTAPGSEQPGTMGAWFNYSIDLASFDLDINGSTGKMLSAPANFGIVNAFPVSDGLQGPNGSFTTGENLAFSMGALSTLFSTNDITALVGSYDLASNLTSFTGMIFGGGGFMEIFPTDLQIKLVGGDPAQFCFGDGGDQMGCTDCPCGNNAALGSAGGCLNSTGGSAQLVQSGTPSVMADTLRFDMNSGAPNTFGILTSGDSRAPANPMSPCFGTDSGITALQLDGLRCVVQSVQRHGTRMLDASGDVGATTPGWGPPDGPMGGLIANGGFTAGQTRHYQVIYRDDMAAVCQTGQNTTQGISVTYEP